MNILITTGIFPPDVGGPAKFVPLIAKRLSEEHNLKVITLSNKILHDNFLEYKILRINRNQNRIIRFFKTTYSILKNGKEVEVIFVNGLWLETYIANLFLKKIIIRKIVGDPIWEKCYINYKINDNFDEFQKKKYNFKIEFLKFVRNTTIRSANTIIVPSMHLYHFVKDLGFTGDLIQVNNGTIISNSYNKKHSSNNFLVVSRLVRHKNIDLIIKSFKLLLDQYSFDFKLNIVGDGPEFNYLNSLIIDLKLENKVFLVGPKYDQDLESYYESSNLFLQISSYEGMPHSILEAMNFGLTIIASNYGGNFELLGNNEYGYIVESLEIETLAKTIQHATADNSQISVKSKNLVNSKYDIEITANKYSEIILKYE